MRTLIEPQIVNTRVGPVQCAVRGDGPAVVTVHGAMGGYDQSDILARTVGGPGFRYISVSRPGYLDTPLSVGASPEQQADALAALLDALDVKRAVVVAISGGGPSAIQFAVRHCARCRGLVLISTCGGVIDERIPLAFHLMKLLARRPWFVKMMRRKAEKSFEKNLGRSIQDSQMRAQTLNDPEVRPLIEELTIGMFDRMGERIAGTENDIRVTRCTEYPLDQIAAPTLVVHGTHDRVVSFRHGQNLAARIPAAIFLPVQGGEHVTIFTHRRQVQNQVSQFLTSLGC